MTVTWERLAELVKASQVDYGPKDMLTGLVHGPTLARLIREEAAKEREAAERGGSAADDERRRQRGLIKRLDDVSEADDRCGWCRDLVQPCPVCMKLNAEICLSTTGCCSCGRRHIGDSP
jgi:hypothetical protein